MTVRLTLAFTFVLLLPGCGKKPESASPAPVPATAATTPGGAITNAEVDLSELSRELRKWIVRNQRPPKNFEEFAAGSGMQIPPAPPGKKYAVDKTMHVILVNR